MIADDLSHFFIAMLSANLINSLAFALKNHQLRSLAAGGAPYSFSEGAGRLRKIPWPDLRPCRLGFFYRLFLRRARMGTP